MMEFFPFKFLLLDLFQLSFLYSAPEHSWELRSTFHLSWMLTPSQSSMKCKMEAAAKHKIKITNQPEVAVMSNVATFLVSVNV